MPPNPPVVATRPVPLSLSRLFSQPLQPPPPLFPASRQPPLLPTAVELFCRRPSFVEPPPNPLTYPILSRFVQSSLDPALPPPESNPPLTTSSNFSHPHDHTVFITHFSKASSWLYIGLHFRRFCSGFQDLHVTDLADAKINSRVRGVCCAGFANAVRHRVAASARVVHIFKMCAREDLSAVNPAQHTPGPH
ncbi:hypothetical protein KSP40_PGU005190 [Platanthera guangdongensis]|uniref:Uncharacterized protein n=1 Tax=Platanthera guangdongensis TaxID=2320717 RepID=A0ABR2MXN3_9ASPA